MNPCDALLAHCRPELPLGIAYSGGADSTALLLAAAARWPAQVHALHVHHGLQAAADDFVKHCEALCARLKLPLHVVRADARHASGESPEEVARKVRYAVLAQLAQSLSLGSVALAQHADDQVETLLLALSRGAGLPGLAAMPERFVRNGTVFIRPILAARGPAIRAWLVEQNIDWIEDPSNADLAFTRNRIRRQLLPALEQAFPSFRETFARSARHAALGQELLNELALQDLQTTGQPPAIKALRQLSRSRQSNVLRHWLKATHAVSASTAQLDELLDQVADCATRGHQINIKVAAGFVQRQGETLAYVAPL